MRTLYFQLAGETCILFGITNYSLCSLKFACILNFSFVTMYVCGGVDRGDMVHDEDEYSFLIKGIISLLSILLIIGNLQNTDKLKTLPKRTFGKFQ